MGEENFHAQFSLCTSMLFCLVFPTVCCNLYLFSASTSINFTERRRPNFFPTHSPVSFVFFLLHDFASNPISQYDVSAPLLLLVDRNDFTSNCCNYFCLCNHRVNINTNTNLSRNYYNFSRVEKNFQDFFPVLLILASLLIHFWISFWFLFLILFYIQRFYTFFFLFFSLKKYIFLSKLQKSCVD